MPKLLKKIMAMDRPTVIDQLRRHAHPSWFHSLLSWKTDALKKVLIYYEAERLAGFKS